MKSSKKFICTILIIIFTILSPSAMYADSPSSAALPPLDKLFDGQNTNEYIGYRENYYLDTIDAGMFSISEQAENIINVIANVLFLLQVQIGYMLVTVFYYAFEIDIYRILSGVVEVFTNEMKKSIFDELSLIAILFLGIFFIIKIIQNQKTQVWVAILQTSLIVALAMYFFTNPLQLLQKVDNGTKEISQTILDGTYKATNKGASANSAVMAAANNIWYVFVHQPWQMLEFGNMEMAKKEERNILTNAPKSETRKEYIKKLAEDEEHFTPDWGIKRLGLILLYFIPISIIFIVILIMCLLMLAYQVLTVLFVLLGVIVFLLALIPFFGTRLLQNWASKIIGFASIKVIVCFCIGVMLAFISSIFKVSDQYGWLITVLLEVVIVGAIIWKKDELFELFTFIRLAPQNPSMVNKQLRKDTNVESKVNNLIKSRNSGFRNSKSSDYEDGYESGEEKLEKNKSSTNSTGSVTKPKSLSNRSIATKTKGETSEQPYSNQLFNEMEQNQSEDNNNFKQLMKKAEEILEKQYEISKMDSEKKAEQMNKEPEYSTFVNKVDTREALGAPKFEQREIIAVAKNLQRIIDSGGKAEDLLKKNEGKEAPRENRPKDVISLVVNGQQQNMDKNEAYKIVLQDASKEYAQEFNEDYGKKYDSKFMEGLIKRYGQQNVRLILNRMKDLQKSEGGIKNPAGYLTQSLKNVPSETGGSMRSKGAEKIE